jgi:hypothetical protein
MKDLLSLFSHDTWWVSWGGFFHDTRRVSLKTYEKLGWHFKKRNVPPELAFHFLKYSVPPNTGGNNTQANSKHALQLY